MIFDLLGAKQVEGFARSVKWSRWPALRSAAGAIRLLADGAAVLSGAVITA
jgi:hypothetical protein